MRKLLASALSVAAVGGPVTVAFAAQEDDPNQPSTAPTVATESARFVAVDQVVERRAQRADRRAAEKRREKKRERGGSASPALQAIAACESGGDPTAVGGGGTYRGKYQFSRETWASVGGSGDPAAAPEGEQDRRAQMLYDRDGAGHWPVCG